MPAATMPGTIMILSANHHGSVAPDWPTGIALGVGSLAGAYTGARLQRRLPGVLIRRLMARGRHRTRCLWSGLS
jgi:uncharacterized membrane protein YfcA